MTYRMLAAATNHPDPVNPYFGLFNARSIQALTCRDVTVDVVSPRPFAPPLGPYSEYREIPPVSDGNGYSVHHPRFFYGVPKRLLYGLSGSSYAKRVPRYVEETFETPDVVHAYHIYLDGYGMMGYARDRDLPLFAVAHGAALNGFEEFGRGVRSRIRKTVEACDELLCVSETLARRAEEVAPGVTTRVVPIGADPGVFPVDQRDRIRRELGIPSDVPVVFFCGQYTERKGLNEVIDVLPGFEDSEVHFVFAGQDGELRRPLRNAILETGISDQVEIHYDVTDEALRRFFAIADLLMLPSYSEGRPTVIYEAMASETAVLASEVDGIPEQVSDGVTGRLIPPRDASALRDALREMCSDRARLREMGVAGYRRLVDEGWTWEAHAERVEGIHREYAER